MNRILFIKFILIIVYNLFIQIVLPHIVNFDMFGVSLIVFI